ncbi:MAG: hypothetical protein HKM04_08895 [Legionellales bacterium]|nr:hypothetical protein [Legionellales bacterium]
MPNKTEILLKNITEIDKNSPLSDIFSYILFRKVLNKNDTLLTEINLGNCTPKTFIEYMNDLETNIRNPWLQNKQPKPNLEESTGLLGKLKSKILTKIEPLIQTNISSYIDTTTYLITYLLQYSQKPPFAGEYFFDPCIKKATEVLFNLIRFANKESEENGKIVIKKNVAQLFELANMATQVKFAELFLQNDGINDDIIQSFCDQLCDRSADSLLKFLEPFIFALKTNPSETNDHLVQLFIERLFISRQAQIIDPNTLPITQREIATLFKRVAKILPLKRNELVFNSPASAIWSNVSPKISPQKISDEALSNGIKLKRKRKRTRNVIIYSFTDQLEKPEMSDANSKSKIKKTVSKPQAKRQQSPKISLPSFDISAVPPESTSDSCMEWQKTQDSFNRITNTVDAYFKTAITYINHDIAVEISVLDEQNFNPDKFQLRDLMSDIDQEKLSEIQKQHQDLEKITYKIKDFPQKILETYKVIEASYQKIANQDNESIYNRITALKELETKIETTNIQLQEKIAKLLKKLDTLSKSLDNEETQVTLAKIQATAFAHHNDNDTYFNKHFFNYIPEGLTASYLDAQDKQLFNIQGLKQYQEQLPKNIQQTNTDIQQIHDSLAAKKDRLLTQIKNTQTETFEPHQSLFDEQINNIRHIFTKASSLTTTVIPESLNLPTHDTLSYEKLLAEHRAAIVLTDDFFFENTDLIKSASQYNNYVAELEKLQSLSNSPILKADFEKTITGYQAIYQEAREKVVTSVEQSYKDLTELIGNKMPDEFFSEENLKQMTLEDLVDLCSSLKNIKKNNSKNENEINTLKQNEEAIKLAILEKNINYTELLKTHLEDFSKQKIIVKSLKNEIIEEHSKKQHLEQIAKFKTVIEHNTKLRTKNLETIQLQVSKINNFNGNLSENLKKLATQITELTKVKINLSSYDLQSDYIQYCDQESQKTFMAVTDEIQQRLNFLSKKQQEYKKIAENLGIKLESALKNEKNHIIMDGNNIFVYSLSADRTIQNENKEIRRIDDYLNSLTLDMNTPLSLLIEEKNQLEKLSNSSKIEFPRQDVLFVKVNDDSPAIIKLYARLSQIRDEVPILTDIIDSSTLNQLCSIVDQNNEIDTSAIVLENITHLVTEQDAKNKERQDTIDTAIRDIKKASLVSSIKKLNQIEDNLRAKEDKFINLKNIYTTICEYKQHTLVQLDKLKVQHDKLERVLISLSTEKIQTILNQADESASTEFRQKRLYIGLQLTELNNQIQQFDETKNQLEYLLNITFLNSNDEISCFRELLELEALEINNTSLEIQNQKNYIEEAQRCLNSKTLATEINFNVSKLINRLAKLNNKSEFVSEEYCKTLDLANEKDVLEKIYFDATATPEKLAAWEKEIKEHQITAEESIRTLKRASLSGWHAHLLQETIDLTNNLERSALQYTELDEQINNLPVSVQQENAELTEKISKKFAKINNWIVDSTYFSHKEKGRKLGTLKEISQNLRSKTDPSKGIQEVSTTHIELLKPCQTSLQTLERKISQLATQLTEGVLLPDFNKNDEAIELADIQARTLLSEYQGTLQKYKQEKLNWDTNLAHTRTNYESAANNCKNEIREDLTQTQSAIKTLKRAVAKREHEISLQRIVTVFSFTLAVAIPVVSALIGGLLGPGGFVAGFVAGCAVVATTKGIKNTFHLAHKLKTSGFKLEPKKNKINMKDEFSFFKQKLDKYGSNVEKNAPEQLVEDIIPAIDNNIISL